MYLSQTLTDLITAARSRWDRPDPPGDAFEFVGGKGRPLFKRSILSCFIK